MHYQYDFTSVQENILDHLSVPASACNTTLRGKSQRPKDNNSNNKKFNKNPNPDIPKKQWRINNLTISSYRGERASWNIG